jgi:hypothetical protein
MQVCAIRFRLGVRRRGGMQVTRMNTAVQQKKQRWAAVTVTRGELVSWTSVSARVSAKCRCPLGSMCAATLLLRRALSWRMA